MNDFQITNGKKKKFSVGLTWTRWAALALVTLQPLVASAFDGGTWLTSRQERTGIFEIRAYDGAARNGRCTATVLYSSHATNRTWLVTAAHCFSYRDDLFYVYGHYQTPRARVRYDLDSDTSGTLEVESPASLSRVFRHPEWLANGGHTSWFGPRDVAFIRVNMAIPIYDGHGTRILEYRRPIYTGSPYRVSDPFSSNSMENFARNVFCGQGDATLRCGSLSNLWFSPNFRNEFLQMPRGAWSSGFFEAGDSGGPLLKYAPGLARRWEGAGSVTDVAMHGVVLGVLQGPTVWCDYIRNGNCDPADGLVTRLSGMNNWLSTIDGANQIPRLTTWTFSGMFRGGLGSTADLTANSESSYTVPAYAARIVGVGIDKATNRVHTWYDDGKRTIGTRVDLDLFSQSNYPGMADILPTLSFNGAPGKSHADIVGMMIDPGGRAYTWYRDRTTTTGTISDLDAYRAPRSFSLPPGKSVDDIVAIANRPSGGVLTYYRDGTVSEGSVRDLDRYGAPTPFQTGNGRDLEEILDLDTRSDGRTVTLFEHPQLF